MAWATETWSFTSATASGTAPDALYVRWSRLDSTIPKARKRGGFSYSLVSAETWATMKANIEARISAEEGIE